MTWFTATEYLYHKWPRIFSTCREHFPILSSFMTYHRFVTGATRRVVLVGQKLPTLPERLGTPTVFSCVRVARPLVFCVVFSKSLFVLLSFFYWSYYCLSFFDLRILIAPLLSSIPLWQQGTTDSVFNIKPNVFIWSANLTNF